MAQFKTCCSSKGLDFCESAPTQGSSQLFVTPYFQNIDSKQTQIEKSANELLNQPIFSSNSKNLPSWN